MGIKVEFTNVTLYTATYAAIHRKDCRRLKFWWGAYEHSASQHYDRVLSLKYMRPSEQIFHCSVSK